MKLDSGIAGIQGCLDFRRVYRHDELSSDIGRNEAIFNKEK